METAAFTPEDTTRTHIAGNVAAELARHRYSKRAAALALGMTPLYLYRRLNSEVEFGGSDLAAIADLLGISPGVFFGETKNAPTPTGEGSKLPELDSNQQPAGNQYPEIAEVIELPVRSAPTWHGEAVITELFA